MSALKGRDVERYLGAPGEDVICALIYGPEQGLVHERALGLAKKVAEDLDDPWRAVSLSEEELGDGPRLRDEAAAQSFLGGRRVIRIRSAGAQVAKATANLLAAAEDGSLRGAGLVIIEAGDLKKSAALRKACEGSRQAVAIPCYQDGPRETRAAVIAQLRADNLTIEDDALDLLVEAAGDDRGILRQETEKLILFMGVPLAGSDEAKAARGPITLEDAAACLADHAGEDSFAVAALSLSGRLQLLSKALLEAEAAGTSVIALLRLTQNRVLRLLPAARAIKEGQSAGAAMKMIRPPVFFKEQDEVTRQLKLWPLGRLERAAASLYEAEEACKVTGAPDQAIAERALLRLAAEAAR